MTKKTIEKKRSLRESIIRWIEGRKVDGQYVGGHMEVLFAIPFVLLALSIMLILV